MCHDRRLRAGAFLHVSTYFGDVVRTGLTTMHVWESLQSKVTPDEIQRYWMPISPYPYISRLSGTGQKVLMVSGRYDPTFWPEFTEQTLAYLRNDGIAYEALQLPCGHYSLGEAPFKWLVGGRFGAFLFQNRHEVRMTIRDLRNVFLIEVFGILLISGTIRLFYA